MPATTQAAAKNSNENRLSSYIKTRDLMSVAILAVLSDSSGHRSLNHTEGLTPGRGLLFAQLATAQRDHEKTHFEHLPYIVVSRWKKIQTQIFQQSSTKEGIEDMLFAIIARHTQRRLYPSSVPWSWKVISTCNIPGSPTELPYPRENQRRTMHAYGRMF